MGLLLNGSVRSAGVTFYLKQGQMIVRSSKTVAKRSNTRGQFVQRQRMRHTTALWQQMKGCHPMFDGGKSTYARFATLANRLPVVFVPCKGPLEGASFLMPDMPVSDGSLTPIKQQLGSVDGIAALLTNLTPDDIQLGNEVTVGMLWPTGKCYANGNGVTTGSGRGVCRHHARLGAGARKTLFHSGGRALLDTGPRHPMPPLRAVHHRGSPPASRQELRRPDGKTLARPKKC